MQNPESPTIPNDVRAFFDAFERLRLHPDPTLTRSLFAERFLVSDSKGTHVVPVDGLIAALPQRKQAFVAAGITEVRLETLASLELDATHVLARTTWAAMRGSEVALELRATFMIRRTTEGLRAEYYLNHGDVVGELAALPPVRA